eukprot:67748-Amphidinium_carterae.1
MALRTISCCNSMRATGQGLAVDAHHLLGVAWHCVDAVVHCDCRKVLVNSMEVGPNVLHLP